MSTSSDTASAEGFPSAAMQSVSIGGKACLLYASASPECFLIQLTARHESQNLETEVAMLRRACGERIAFLAFDVGEWAVALMPWPDEAVSKDARVGHHAADTLACIEQHLLPWLTARYGNKPCAIGGYSLGGLFALWASCSTGAFSAVAAASPSVWIRGWVHYAETHATRAQQVYLSLGDREEHCRNVRMAQVGTCIRRQGELLAEALGTENTVLEWNEGNHFNNEAQRMARAFEWCVGRFFIKS